MLNCKEAVSLSDRYIERELGLRQRLLVACHLLICRDCRRFFAQMRTAMHVFQNKGETLPADEADKIARMASGAD